MTWFRVGVAGIPATLKNAMNAVFNKKFGTSGQNYPPKQWPDDVNLMGPLPEATASGAIAVIDDGADDVPTKSVKITLPASLDGYSAVEVVNEGKNLIGDIQQGGIDATTGEETVSNTRVRTGFIKVRPSTSYISAVNSSNTNLVIFHFIEYDANKNFIRSLEKNTGTATQTTGATTEYIRITSRDLTSINISPSDLDKWQLELGSTASTYTPYIAPTTHTASLGRTIYGGEVDIVNGTGTEDYDKGSMSSTYLSGLNSDYIGYEASTAYFGGHPSVWVRNWNYQRAKARQSGGIGCICNYFPISMHNTTIFSAQYRIYFDVNGKNISSVADFIAFVANLEANNESLDIAYELNDTYTTDFTFTGQEVPTRLGYNAFWSDSGDTEVTYRRDIDLALQAVSSSRGLMMASRPVAQLVGEESDLDQVNELNEEAENTEEQEGESDAR